MYDKNIDMAVKIAALVSQRAEQLTMLADMYETRFDTRITKTLILRFMESIHIS